MVKITAAGPLKLDMPLQFDADTILKCLTAGRTAIGASATPEETAVMNAAIDGLNAAPKID
jgi:hypothetical protein